uniref:Uncharacterized protein n=1 Tax=Myoviridae sp. ctgpD8 TaxID=2825149 RepID=A0A8S5QIA4_9CAUD|nr:MAG TPA: hypothetical protein [Myoviridae sp. ctgpD8]
MREGQRRGNRHRCRGSFLCPADALAPPATGIHTGDAGRQ